MCTEINSEYLFFVIVEDGKKGKEIQDKKFESLLFTWIFPFGQLSYLIVTN